MLIPFYGGSVICNICTLATLLLQIVHSGEKKEFGFLYCVIFANFITYLSRKLFIPLYYRHSNYMLHQHPCFSNLLVLRNDRICLFSVILLGYEYINKIQYLYQQNMTTSELKTMVGPSQRGSVISHNLLPSNLVSRTWIFGKKLKFQLFLCIPLNI